jgi:hypothetical protein
VLILLKILTASVLDLCLWSVQPEVMAVFMVFNLWNGPGFIFIFVVKFFIFQ